MDELAEDHNPIVERCRKLKLPQKALKVILLSKADTFHSCHMYDVEEAVSTLLNRTKTISISSTNGHGIDVIKNTIVDYANNIKNNASDVVVTNLRHYEALKKINDSLTKVNKGISSGISSDFVAMDIRHALHYIGEISGTVSTDDLLENIFSNFCIGK